MKSNLRDKFRDFLASEEGRVGVKAPLAVGIAGGSLLLAQAMFPADGQAHMECDDNGDCSPGEICLHGETKEWSAGCQCVVTIKHSQCVGH
ncbi:hypothetical protein F4X88_01455 [Candidatus Poribacteria bacterium]|nr:hypothetical protein [Candidatus Poribacteria bacterium]MYA54937.1 hypothetical protein [Candidatus Poribacteria bacterium]